MRARDLPPADRFFARVLAVDLECPACGAILSLRSWRLSEGPNPSPRRLQKDAAWNPLTGRLQCTKCQAIFASGFLVYPVANERGGTTGDHIPEDHRPTELQRKALQALGRTRRRSEGWALGDRKRRGESTNIAITEPCTCPADGAWALDCPIHRYLAEAVNRKD